MLSPILRRPVLLCVAFQLLWALAVAAPGPTASQAARTLAAAGRVEFPVSGQPRTLMLATDEAAVSRRGADPGAFPAGAREISSDAQHRLIHLPATVTAANWLDRAVGTPDATTALAPVFYEQGRAREAASRLIATPKLLLVGLDRATADVAAAATGALSVAPSATDELWVLSYGSPYRMLWAADALQREGLRVEPQFTRARVKRVAPNDPLYNQQFYFKNTGQAGGTPGEDLNIESLWPAASGAGVTISVVDDGLEITHPDLAPNVVADASLHRNVLDENNDVTPPSAANHGTICAGFIAARGGNGIGLTGAAPLARLLGVRLLGEGKNGDSASDVQEAAAFGWRTDVVQISSNSWGPSDDGKALSAPDTAALAALRAGVTTGRGGRGVLYFVASGNGRDEGDYAGYDGYSGSRFVIAIGATDQRGKQAPFSESGPQVLACAAGQTIEGSDTQLLATDNIGARGANTAASPEGDYTTSGVQGTSYSTPQVAGVAALLLQANPTLGWRDVKEILIRTARKNDATDADWLNNGAGFKFSHKYGAGFVDAVAALAAARTWTNLAAELSVTQASTTVAAIPDESATGVSRAITISSATNLRVETVEVTVNVAHANRGQLRFELTSPAGTRTVLGAPRTPDTGANFTNWTFSSPRHWGEMGNGVWTVRVFDTIAGVEGTLTGASVTLYGTAAATPPVFATQPASQTQSAGNPLTLTAATTADATYQWQFNGSAIAGATSASYSVANFQSSNAGLYVITATTGGASTTSAAAIAGVASTAKVIGTARELAANIPHPNTNIFDQILLEGAAATVTADAGQAIRLSYIDLQNDIVQVEFSGAGTLSIVLDGMSGPAVPVAYNQPTVSYMKGHAGIVVTGANETTNLLIFTVGRATAFDPTGGYNILAAPSATNVPSNNGSSLFQGHAARVYDGVADISFVAISSTNGKFGGLRSSNTSYWATKGVTGIYAPGVTFTGPVFAHNINASDSATPFFVIGGSSDTRITGGDLAQSNNRAVQVAGLSQLKFTAGITSHGGSLSAKTNLGRLERDGVDVTAQIVVNPVP